MLIVRKTEKSYVSKNLTEILANISEYVEYDIDVKVTDFIK